MAKHSIQNLKDIAHLLRIKIIKMVYLAKCGHFGGPFSCIDMLTGLFFHKMRYDPKNPRWEGRDRFVMSTGHACAALYATLSHMGVIPEEELWTFRKFGSRLQGHPKRNLDIGIEMSTGSLGQGMSIGNGMALAARVLKKDYRVYSLESDGGSQEGMFWEGAMNAGHRKLDNRCVLVDLNNIQIDGYVSDIKDVAPYAEKLRAFRWHVIEIDGHNLEEICVALDEAEKTKGKPTAIVGKTVMAKGMPSFENKSKWHGVAPNEEEYKLALKELGVE